MRVSEPRPIVSVGDGVPTIIFQKTVHGWVVSVGDARFGGTDLMLAVRDAMFYVNVQATNTIDRLMQALDNAHRMRADAEVA